MLIGPIAAFLLSPGFCLNSCLLRRWCYLTISSSASLFSLVFNLSQHQGLFQWVSSSSHQVAKSIGASALASVLPVNTQDWSPLRWTGWTSLQSKGLSKVFSNTTSILQRSAFFTVNPSSVQFSYSIVSTLCNPMNHSTHVPFFVEFRC